MKSRSELRQQNATSATMSARAIPADLSPNVGGDTAANDDVANRRVHIVNPLWMITVALAILFALYAVLFVFS
ncbi:MAG TPA: hypothetical protein VIL28_03340 [Steroidobacteraceae bacterium]